jgi:hypothetical protein
VFFQLADPLIFSGEPPVFGFVLASGFGAEIYLFGSVPKNWMPNVGTESESC